MAILYPDVSARDHVLGDASARVTIAQYGDYECPVSHEVYRLIEMLREAMGRDVRYVYRHFPLNKLHPRAEAAAHAAEAADAQGKFWEMHAQLYENRKDLSDDALRTQAEALDLDVDRFEQDRRAEATAARIREDQRFGVRSGVDTTRNLFINGQRYIGEMKFSQIAAAIEAQSKPEG